MGRVWAAALALVALVVAVPASASPGSRARTQQAFALAYDLQFEAAHETLAEAILADPADPAPHRAVAAITWIEILFAQGAATFEAFTGEVPESDVARPAPPAPLVWRFSQSIGRAAQLAQRQVAQHDDADAHYQAGATAGLEAVYRGTVEGRAVGALKHGRRAVAAMQRARARCPAMPEAALLLAMSEYTVATLPWPVRMLARLNGLSGSRTRAMALLGEAASPGASTATDALLFKMIVDAREGRHAHVITDVRMLQARHPGNRLLWLNEGAAALAAHRMQEADAALSEGITGRLWESSPRIQGEAALWLAHRGTARAALVRRSEAVDDLMRALASSPRDWVRGRVHYQLGHLAVSAGETAEAHREFEAAVACSTRGGDTVMVKRAVHALASMPRR